MAILKHLSSKSADYGKALEYLIFQHNERTQKPILDENGSMMLREEFYLDGLNCDSYSFDMECQELNAAFHKNQNYNDIKSHHYILSFDPLDADESGLTGARAQSIGLEFAKRFFPGHQALVCTHMDGHNGSGNIHCHIVINSLRKLNVDRQDFMERDCDCRAGFKHHQTRTYLTAMQEGIMEIAKREHLHQVDLRSPSEVKISEREYWKNRREQEKLDDLNEQIIADGLTPAKTKYQTQKQFLRDAITDIAATAGSDTDFISAMKEKYGITVKDHRGRYSYLHPDREKYITGRALGSIFEKEYLLDHFAENANKIPEHREHAPLSNNSLEKDNNIITSEEKLNDYDPNYDYAADPVAILYVRSHLRLVVDLQTNIKAQQNAAYARKVKISNLQEMARTVCFVQEHGYDTRDELSLAASDISSQFTDARNTLRATESKIKDINEQIHYAGQYYATKAVQTAFLKSRNKNKYRQEHLSDLEKYDAAVKYFKEHHAGLIPELKGLRAQRDQLLQMKEAQLGTYRYFKDYKQEMDTVSANVDAILAGEQMRTKGREKAQELS